MAQRSLLVGVCLVILSGTMQAEIVALKRSPSLSFDYGGMVDDISDSRFASATVVVTTTGDTRMFTANPGSNGDWENYGATSPLPGQGLHLYKFDLSAVPALAGATIHLAELRLHNLSGNSGGAVGRVATHDWLEGTQDGGFPGAAGGASWAHPAGFNTGSGQDADGGTTGPLASWGPGSDSRFSTSADGDMERAAKPGTSPGADWQVFDVTDIVATWTQPAGADPNYGFYLDPGNYPRHTGESDPAVQPVLFIDFVPEPAAASLLALGGLALLRRRRRAG